MSAKAPPNSHFITPLLKPPSKLPVSPFKYPTPSRPPCFPNTPPTSLQSKFPLGRSPPKLPQAAFHSLPNPYTPDASHLPPNGPVPPLPAPSTRPSCFLLTIERGQLPQLHSLVLVHMLQPLRPEQLLNHIRSLIHRGFCIPRYQHVQILVITIIHVSLFLSPLLH